jgi:hypothetical protein
VTRCDLRSLFAVLLVSASACGLAKGGLLVIPDGGEPIFDASTQDEPVTGDEPSTAPDDGSSLDGTLLDADMTEAGAGDASDAAKVRRDAGLDAQGEGDAPSRSLDATPDVAVDAPSDAPNDASADAADAPSDAPSDAPDDVAPAPIVYDGGAIADPTFSDAEWVDFCVALVGCGELPSVSGCMALLKQPATPDALIPPESMISAAGIAAPTCSLVLAALDDGAACTAADTCSGNALVTCRWGFRMTIPCGPLGMVCSDGSGNAGCGFGDCNSGQEGLSYCVGTNYVATCTQGRYVPSLDCNTFGATCAGGPGSAACVASGGQSCTTGVASCDGHDLVECMGGQPGSVDCSQAYGHGFACFTDPAGTPTCAQDTACDPATSVDVCNPDSSLTFCNAGTLDDYDCLGNAWGGCGGGSCTP